MDKGILNLRFFSFLLISALLITPSLSFADDLIESLRDKGCEITEQVHFMAQLEADMSVSEIEKILSEPAEEYDNIFGDGKTIAVWRYERLLKTDEIILIIYERNEAKSIHYTNNYDLNINKNSKVNALETLEMVREKTKKMETVNIAKKSTVDRKKIKGFNDIFDIITFDMNLDEIAGFFDSEGKRVASTPEEMYSWFNDEEVLTVTFKDDILVTKYYQGFGMDITVDKRKNTTKEYRNVNIKSAE